MLNNHSRHDNGYTGMNKECVDILNRIINLYDPDIVVHSAWRYLVLNGSMTLDGLSNLLASHGINTHREHDYTRIIGVTRMDKNTTLEDRVDQILEYPKDKPWIVIDDLNLSLPVKHFYKTNPKQGLTEQSFQDITNMIEKQFKKDEQR